MITAPRMVHPIQDGSTAGRDQSASLRSRSDHALAGAAAELSAQLESITAEIQRRAEIDRRRRQRPSRRPIADPQRLRRAAVAETNRFLNWRLDRGHAIDGADIARYFESLLRQSQRREASS